MTAAFALALAQINPTVGDVAGNLAKIRAARAQAAAAQQNTYSDRWKASLWPASSGSTGA